MPADLVQVPGGFGRPGEMAHERLPQGVRHAHAIDGAGHAFQPEVAHLRSDGHMLVDFHQSGMAVLLHVAAGTAEEAGQVVELLLARMRDAMPPQMQEMELPCILILLDDVVEGFDQRADAGSSPSCW